MTVTVSRSFRGARSKGVVDQCVHHSSCSGGSVGQVYVSHSPGANSIVCYGVQPGFPILFALALVISGGVCASLMFWLLK